MINIGTQFSKYPAGRFVSDGPSSGQAFRERHLIPALNESNTKIVVEFDDARGYGSSFLEEAFGGLVRAGFNSRNLLSRLEFRSKDKSIVEEVKLYILEQNEVTSQARNR